MLLPGRLPCDPVDAAVRSVQLDMARHGTAKHGGEQEAPGGPAAAGVGTQHVVRSQYSRPQHGAPLCGKLTGGA